MVKKTEGVERLAALSILIACIGLVPMISSPPLAQGYAWGSDQVMMYIDAPVLSAISNGDCDDAYTVDWNDVAGAVSYWGQEALDPDFAAVIRNFYPIASQVSFTGHDSGRFYYRIKAIDGASGESAWSNSESVCVCPSAPVLSIIVNLDCDGDYTVDWPDTSRATSYTLEEDDNASFTSPTQVYSGAASQHAVSGQSAGQWYYRVKAIVDGACESPWSIQQSVIVCPSVPVLNSIDNADCDDAYTVDWDDVPGAISYTLEVDDDPAFGSFATVYAGAATQHAVSGQSTGQWYYRVHIYFPLGVEDYSNVEDVSVRPGVPTISAIDNADCDGAYTVDWDDVPGAVSYRAQEALDPAFTVGLREFTPTGSQSSIVDRDPGRYYYRVKAVAEGGCESDWSAVQNICVCPATPTLYAIGNPEFDGDYLVDWSDVAGSTYILEEDDNPGFTSPAQVYVGATSQYTASGQSTGVWFYRVKTVVDATCESGWSSTQFTAVYVTLPVLNPISNPDCDGAYTVDWDDVPGATAYDLEEDDDPSFSSPTTVYSGLTSQHAVSGQAGGIWYYRVHVYYPLSLDDYSNTESVSVRPGTPTISAISNPECDGDYTVDWDDVSGATSYWIQEALDPGFTLSVRDYYPTVSQFDATARTPDRYYYRVKAIVDGTCDGDWSATQDVGVCPGTPFLNYIPNPECDDTYTITWSASTGALTYTLEEDDNETFTSPTEVYLGSAPQHTVTGQPTGRYFYRVKAAGDGGESGWSLVQNPFYGVVVCQSPLILYPIDNTDCDGAFTVDWSDVTGTLTYYLYESQDPTFPADGTAQYNAGTTSQYAITGRTGGTWYYRVRALVSVAPIMYSDYSSVETADVCPSAPVLNSISNPECDNTYTVDWDEVPSATSYTLEEDDNASFTSPVTAYAGPDTEYAVSGQSVGSWYYRVMATSPISDTGWSTTQGVSVCASVPVLNPISDPECDGAYTVDWDDVTDAISYTLEVDDDPGFSTPTEVYSGSVSQHDVSGQSTGVWYYRVHIYYTAGGDAYSNIESVCVCPAAPTLYAISNTSPFWFYTVDWDPVAGATSYVLEEDVDPAFGTAIEVYSGPNTDYTVVHSSVSGRFYYRVKAIFAAGCESAWSTTQDTCVPPASVPTLYAISNPECDGDYTITWSEVAVLGGYYVLEVDDNASFTSPTEVYTGAEPLYDVVGQAAGTWYYRVKVTADATCESGWSTTRSVGVCPNTPSLDPISNPDCNGDYTVSWGAVTGATTYTLEEDDNASFTSPSVVYSGTGTSHAVGGQGTGLWYYRVKAANAAGESGWSSTQNVLVCLSGPTLNAISNPDCDGGYLTSWSIVPGATLYTLQVDDDPAFGSPSTAYLGGSTQYLVSGQDGGRWYYRVKATILGVDTSWSNVQNVCVCLDAPVIDVIVNVGCNGTYTVTWSAVSGVTTYTLEVDDNASFTSPSVAYAGAEPEFAVTGQAPGHWYYRVMATADATCEGPWSGTQDVGVCPDAPTLNAIDNPDCDGTYTITWTAVTGVGSYTLEEDDDAAFSSPSVVYVGSNTEHVVSGQSTGRWYYRVKATNAEGDSPWSNAQDVGVCPAAPILNAIDNADCDDTYTVDWTAVTGATSYTLEVDDDPGFGSPTAVYSGSGTSHAVSGQTTGRWYYRVLASNAGGESPWSNTQDVGVCPAAPVLNTISNPECDGDYTVDWSTVTGAISYTLEEDDDPGFGSPTVISGSGTSHAVSGQGTGRWYYRVLADNAGGESPWSNAQDVGVCPAAPPLNAIDNPDCDGTYAITWTAVTGAISYTLEEDDDPGFGSPTAVYSGSGTSHAVSGQGTGRWYYRVLAGNAGGDSPWSNTQDVGVCPPAPVLNAIDNADCDGAYTVDWSAVTGATTYTLEVDDDPAFGSPTVAYAGSSISHTVSGQGTGLWYYRVQAGNAGGDSPWSNTQDVGVCPPAPVLNAISNPECDGDYTVDWSAVTGAISYTLEEDDDPGFGSPTVVYSGSGTSHAVSGQAIGRWYYRVKAANAGGESIWSNTQDVGVCPAAPVLSAIDNPDCDGTYTITWTAVTGAISYTLEEDDNAAFTSPMVVYAGSSISHTVSGQATGRWYYRVLASHAGEDSPWSNTQDVGVCPAAPALNAIDNADCDGSYTVGWSAVAGATTYTLEVDDDPAFGSPTVVYSGSGTSHAVSGQTTGRWYYRVLAGNAGGEGPWSNTQDVGVCPPAPVLSAISNPECDGDYTVDWSTVTGATTYTLEVDDDPAFGSPTVAYASGGTTHTVSGQDPGLWYYRVKASNAGGEGPWSSTQGVGVCPAAPTLNAIDNPDCDGTYTVTWTSVTGVTTYTLEVDDDPGFGSPTVAYVGSGTSLAVSGQGLDLWHYRVRASGDGGDGAWSATQSVQVCYFLYLPLIAREYQAPLIPWPPRRGGEIE